MTQLVVVLDCNFRLLSDSVRGRWCLVVLCFFITRSTKTGAQGDDVRRNSAQREQRLCDDLLRKKPLRRPIYIQHHLQFNGRLEASDRSLEFESGKKREIQRRKKKKRYSLSIGCEVRRLAQRTRRQRGGDTRSPGSSPPTRASLASQESCIWLGTRAELASTWIEPAAVLGGFFSLCFHHVQ